MKLGKNGSWLPVLEALAGFIFVFESILSLMAGKWHAGALGLIVGAVLVQLGFRQLMRQDPPPANEHEEG